LLAAENATRWLNQWQPQLAPNILSQPASLAVAGGQPAAFFVAATGIPDAAYQWLKNGNIIPGATGATFTIPAAYAGDAASYSVVVSNVAGVVTSGSAVLTVGNTAPSLDPISDQTINPGETLSLTATASDPDSPPQSLTFTLSTAPANASIGSGSGLLTWRPSVTQANTTNVVTVVVTDNGAGNLNASQSFQVIVNPLSVSTLGSAARAPGQFSFSVGSGTLGPDYIVLASTDLVNWQPIFTNGSAATPFTFTDTNVSGFPKRFYRIQLAP
jgi:hypothetical protein